MFDWLKALRSKPSGLDEIMRFFEQMLEDGRHCFDAAANALLGGTDPEVIKEDLWATDKRINRNERRIRRMLITHAAVHGHTEFPVCLALMSLVKDAERIGDYSKNLFDLAALRAGLPEDARKDLVQLKDTVSRLLAKARNIYDDQDEDGARAFIAECDAIQDECDARVDALILRDDGGGELAAAALTYRYFKRVVSHALNIITSVVVPLDRLDYYDEDKEGRDPLDD